MYIYIYCKWRWNLLAVHANYALILCLQQGRLWKRLEDSFHTNGQNIAELVGKQ